MDNKHRKLLVTKQSKGCKFMPIMHQNKSGGRTLPEPAGERSPRLLSCNGGVLLRGDGREKRGDGKGGEVMPPQSQGE